MQINLAMTQEKRVSMMRPMQTIHERIHQLRTAKKLSMQALAAACGVTWQTVQQWERDGGTAPKRARLEKVASALGTSQEYLLTGQYSTASVQIRRAGEREVAPYRHTNKHIAEVIKLLEETDEVGRAMGLAAVRVALAEYRPTKANKRT